MPTEVPVEALQVGMIVGRNVNDSRGNLLVQIGTTLNDQIIQLLQRRGIPEITISSAEDEQRRQVTEALEIATVKARRDAKLGKRATEKLGTVLDYVDQLFVGYDGNDVMVPLHTAAVNYWQRKAQSSEESFSEDEGDSQ